MNTKSLQNVLSLAQACLTGKPVNADPAVMAELWTDIGQVQKDLTALREAEAAKKDTDHG